VSRVAQPPSPVALAPLVLCLIAAPSHATLTLSTSGPGLTACGDQLCLEIGWRLEGETTTEFSGERSWTFPTPDPEVWELSGGELLHIGSASWVGTFDRIDIDQATNFENESDPEDNLVGFVEPQIIVLGANGDLLIRQSSPLVAYCGVSGDECFDYNLIAGGGSEVELRNQIRKE